jgi:hypothetical protein
VIIQTAYRSKMTRSIKAFYSSIILTEEEKEEALLEGKKKKYFIEKHKPLLAGKREC